MYSGALGYIGLFIEVVLFLVLSASRDIIEKFHIWKNTNEGK